MEPETYTGTRRGSKDCSDHPRGRLPAYAATKPACRGPNRRGSAYQPPVRSGRLPVAEGLDLARTPGQSRAVRRSGPLPGRTAAATDRGDGIERLPRLTAAISDDAAICVFHTHVANQMPPEAKRCLERQIKEIGSNRDLFHLYNNMWDANLHLDEYIGGMERRATLAETDGHGRWFRWTYPGA